MFLGLRARLFITMVKIFVFDPLQEREHICIFTEAQWVSFLQKWWVKKAYFSVNVICLIPEKEISNSAMIFLIFYFISVSIFSKKLMVPQVPLVPEVPRSDYPQFNNTLSCLRRMSAVDNDYDIIKVVIIVITRMSVSLYQNNIKTQNGDTIR